MTACAALVALLLAGALGERPAIVVHGPDSPVRIDRATILTGADGPPVLLYASTNVTANDLDQFTVIAFVFDATGVLKARQVAPARRTLEAGSAKYSTMVLDGSPIGPTDLVVVGVNQAQRVDSEVWWRADLQTAAEAAARASKPQP